LLRFASGLFFLRRNDASIQPRAKAVRWSHRKPVTAKVIANSAPATPEETVEPDTTDEQA
jgi:hypothetical protein